MNFQLSEIDLSVFASQLVFVLGLRLLAFLFFQSYAGIIRHTSIEDAILILKAVFTGTLGAVVVSGVIRNTLGFEHVFNLSASILIIDFFICLFWMVILRFFVKSFYESFINQFKPTIGVLIYGAGYTGMLTKNVFQTDRSTNYKILGFIDDNESKIGKTIE
jgi:FlaA1/EpsC-like NDP-sugar epimerase